MEVRAEQGPLAGFILNVENGAVVAGAFDPKEYAAYRLVTTEETLKARHPEASHVTRESVPGGDIYCVWASADADDPWLVYGEAESSYPAAEAAPKPALVWVGPEHVCDDHATYYEGGDGPLGHGWTCGVCGALLQVG